MEEIHVLRLASRYMKMHGESRARLLASVSYRVDKMRDRELLYYETLREDGTRYDGIEDGGWYLMLLFLGEQGHLFTIMRRQTQARIELYDHLIGKTFDFRIEAGR